MLIRSQNKKRIINFSLISDLVVSRNDNNNRWEILAYHPCLTQSNCEPSIIGVYSTKEKAIKVLDDICSFADGLHFETILPDRSGRKKGVVFQMPQDDKLN